MITTIAVRITERHIAISSCSIFLGLRERSRGEHSPVHAEHGSDSLSLKISLLINSLDAEHFGFFVSLSTLPGSNAHLVVLLKNMLQSIKIVLDDRLNVTRTHRIDRKLHVV